MVAWTRAIYRGQYPRKGIDWGRLFRALHFNCHPGCSPNWFSLRNKTRPWMQRFHCSINIFREWAFNLTKGKSQEVLCLPLPLAQLLEYDWINSKYIILKTFIEIACISDFVSKYIFSLFKVGRQADSRHKRFFSICRKCLKVPRLAARSLFI